VAIVVGVGDQKCICGLEMEEESGKIMLKNGVKMCNSNWNQPERTGAGVYTGTYCNYICIRKRVSDHTSKHCSIVLLCSLLCYIC